jgi:hypothetical protein
MIPRLVLLIALFTAPAHAFSRDQSGSQPPAPVRSGSSSIAGTVVDSATGTPVPRATVTTQISSDELIVVAESNGSFRFEGIPPGKYRVYATAPGYIREGLNQHGGFFTGVVVGPDIDSEHVVFRLHPQAVIHGRVTEDRGQPVRHAAVMLYHVASESQPQVSMVNGTQTDDLGEYRFAHLPAGAYFISVQCNPWYAQTSPRFAAHNSDSASFEHFGNPYTSAKIDPAFDVVFPITFYPGVTDEHSASPLNLSSGDTQQADISLRAVPAVHLRVTNLPVNQNGVPGVGASQKIFGSLLAGISMSVSQISPGEFEFAGLPPGDITFLLNSDKPNGPSRVLEASVADGATLDASRIPAPASVSGRVIFPSGSPEISDGNVILFMRDNNASPAIPLRKDGSFSSSPMDPGSYRLLVQLSDSSGFIQKISASGAKLHGRELSISAGAEVKLTIALAEGVGQISGFAVLDGHSAPGAMVLLLPDLPENIDDDSRMDQSDSDGSFLLGSIVPGKYRLLGIQDGWNLDWRDSAVLKPYLTKALPLQIAPNDSKKLTLEVHAKVK